MAGLTVGVLGIGGVGVAAASAIVTRGLAGRVTLYARNGDAAPRTGARLHARAAAPVEHRGARLRSRRDRTEDIMVITAGHHTTPGESRLDVLQKNIEVMADIATTLEATELPKIVIVVTNPLDVLTEYLTRRWKGQPVSVMGSGTALETLRLTDAIARRVRGPPAAACAWVVGEHGDSCVVLLGSAVVGTLPLLEFAAQRDVPLSPDRLTEIEQEVRDAAYRVRALKGSTAQGIGLTVSGLVHALAHEVGALIPVSVRVDDRVCASLPCVLGPDGPSAPLLPQMTESEQHRVGALARRAHRGERVVADLSYVSPSRSRRAAIAAPISSDAVAAGDGTLSTCTARPTVWIAKSSTSSPSGPIASARTPRGARLPGRRARAPAPACRATAANRRRLSERVISSTPKRQCRNANRRKPRNAKVSRRWRRSMRRHS